MSTLTEIDQAITAIEDFSHSSQLPFPEHVKQMMLREEFPKLVQQLREAYENLNPPKDVSPTPRKPAFSIRGAISTD